MQWLNRLVRVVFPRRDETAVSSELRLHVDLETDDLIRRGIPRDEARRQALMAFGSIETVRDEARGIRRLGWLDALQLDLRHSFRSLRRTPGVTLVIIATLAIGVGANASLYALVDGLMFRPPTGVRDPERLVSVNSASNYVRFLDIEEQSKTLSAAAYTRRTLSLGRDADAMEIRVECVTAGYFPVLGAQPIVGRGFRREASPEQDEPTVVLAHDVWERRFNASRQILGQPMVISGRTYTVIGVMPRGFTGLLPEPADAWILLTASPESCSLSGRNTLLSASGGWLSSVGRLGDGITLKQAEAEVLSLASPQEQFRRATERQAAPRAELTPIHESRRERLARDAGLAVWLLGGAGVLLLIACANVAGLLSIRAIDRRRENTVRLQLGASRGMLLRQFLVEQLLVSLACGAAAVVLSLEINSLLATFFPYAVMVEPPRGQVFVLGGILAFLAALVSGVVPAYQASSARATALAESSTFSSRERAGFRSGLLILQVALAFVLVIGGGLFARSVRNTAQNLGYNPDGLYVVAVDLRRAGFGNAADIREAFDSITRATSQLASIDDVALSSGAFLGAGGPSLARPSWPGGPNVIVTAISPEYFATIGSKILRGRAFTENDGQTAKRVAIIDETTAREEWPGEDALGKCGLTGSAATCREVVGIVERRRRSLGSASAGGDLFVPLAQADSDQVPQMILVRTKEPSTPAHQAIAAAVRAAVPALPYVSVRSFQDLADVQTRSWRLGQTMFGVFAGVGVFLCVLGLYSVLALAARQRTTEIGVRMALGARPIDIVRLVLRQATALVGTGWLLGLAGAVLCGRYIETLLFQVKPTDALTFCVASLVVLAAGAAGCLIPASRAARVSPVRALRHE